MDKESNPTQTSNEEPQVYNVSYKTGTPKFSRRKFVEAASMTVAAAVISGCTPDAGGAGSSKVTLPPAFTDTPAPTETQPPTPTATKTRTPTPTATSTYTPTPVSVIVKIANQGARVRTGPGTYYPIIGSLATNVELLVVGRLADNSWLRVRVQTADLPNFQDSSIDEVEGWIRADQVGLAGISLDGLPVDEAPPTPTPLPNETIEPGEEGIQYEYTDLYGNVQSFTLPCGSPIPDGAVCVCNCVSTCSCDTYVAPPADDSGTWGTTCTCDTVHYWYPN